MSSGKEIFLRQALDRCHRTFKHAGPGLLAIVDGGAHEAMERLFPCHSCVFAAPARIVHQETTTPNSSRYLITVLVRLSYPVNVSS